MEQSIDKKYRILKENFDELISVINDYESIQKENYYLLQFINFKGLSEEYEYFKENAHEAIDEDNPFPPLIL